MIPTIRAPQGDGELLAVPHFAEFEGLIARNQHRRATWPAFGELPLKEWPAELLKSNLPILMTGHQPEFYHPGVWVKNFAAAGLAERFGLAALDLTVDNDIPKAAGLKVPVGDFAADTFARSVQAASVPFEIPLPRDVPYEQLPSFPRRQFHDFLDRLGRQTQALKVPAISDSQQLRAGTTDPVKLGILAVEMRQRFQTQWGLRIGELTVGRLSRQKCFARFLAVCLSDIESLCYHYNAAVLRYRKRFKVRSASHPVPLLARDGDLLETPFWVWTAERPQRSRLLAAWGANDHLRLYHPPEEILSASFPRRKIADMTEVLCQLSDAHGLCIRPRALMLTLFTRLCVATAFLHGIGGGKYDLVTDDLIRSWLKIDPPEYGVVSATLRLPLPRFPDAGAALRLAHRRQRDLLWNPQQFLGNDELTAEFLAVQQMPTPTRAGRRSQAAEFRRIKELMRRRLGTEFAEVEKAIAIAEMLARADRILSHREYSWLLYPEGMLHDFLMGVYDRARKGG